ncbi:MAG: hypothetical protein IPP42_01000 [Saprospiraceae bacterium]|nr:hypothetical protein [Saprospiraceae bacterium]
MISPKPKYRFGDQGIRFLILWLSSTTITPRMQLQQFNLSPDQSVSCDQHLISGSKKLSSSDALP